jgi:hypothetical protein
VNRLAIAVVTGALAATPAVAQQTQSQGQNGNLSNIIEQVGRSLSGNGSAGNAQQDAQQTRDQTAQQYHGASDQQLQQDRQRLNDAQARLGAASQALDQEMSHRGLRVGSNQSGSGYGGDDHYTGNRSSEGMSGSSVPPGYGKVQNNNGMGSSNGSGANGSGGTVHYTGPNGQDRQGGSYNGNESGTSGSNGSNGYNGR